MENTAPYGIYLITILLTMTGLCLSVYWCSKPDKCKKCKKTHIEYMGEGKDGRWVKISVPRCRCDKLES